MLDSQTLHLSQQALQIVDRIEKEGRQALHPEIKSLQSSEELQELSAELLAYCIGQMREGLTWEDVEGVAMVAAAISAEAESLKVEVSTSSIQMPRSTQSGKFLSSLNTLTQSPAQRALI